MRRAHRATPPRHPVTGRFLAFDCEIDCQDHCAGLCGAVLIMDDDDDGVL
jgi:hypothetical protein